MENSPNREAEDSSYLCFQRTPSLRRKWRKRYGGLDGNKLLEPHKDPDMKAEDGGMTDESQRRSPENQKPETRDLRGACQSEGITFIQHLCTSSSPLSTQEPDPEPGPDSGQESSPEAHQPSQSWTSSGPSVGQQWLPEAPSPSGGGPAGGPRLPPLPGLVLPPAESVQTQSLAGRLCAEEEEKYDSVLNVVWRLCNKEHVNLNCTSYQSRRKATVRLHALSLYLQEKKCFPEKVDVNAALDLMLQCSSTEVTCESGAAMAASLANGGLCPLSGDQVLSPAATRSMLSVMQVAGMKDYSTAFHYKTSVPAVSSSHGSLLAVVPGVLGLMAFSPELDACGNPWRAVHFCQELISTFQLHSFDIGTPFRQILAYRQWKAESEGYQIMNVLLAAFKGDVQSLRRYFLSGVDVNAVDYDGRSALHVAAAEGHTEVICFLLEKAGANPALRDRWGSCPLQEARRHNEDSAVQLLLGAIRPNPPTNLTWDLGRSCFTEGSLGN
ncbi:glutaminase liver isoform, mitochondrial isoform X3 [Xiphias gladius]|uniref:glutaminase liver isoform, mitochondrial isoform X3 n=1 Tax=Xiphias gladius TaxID=8245 RepID=UPI001A98E2E9|nr:glutaminase liver isoform, mitochondrial isoform X3 [Xiphias gladius]